jgi:hypothetical protein
MDELFSNLVYFIPVAFIIALRIINARQKHERKQQQKKAAPANTAQVRPAQARPAQAPGPVTQTSAWPDTRKKAVKKTPAKAAKAPVPQMGYKSAFPDAVEIPAAGSAVTESERRGPENAVSAVAQHTGVDAVSSVAQYTGVVGVSSIEQRTVTPADAHKTPLGNLPPLQQALVWSEILGAPRAEQ